MVTSQTISTPLWKLIAQDVKNNWRQ